MANMLKIFTQHPHEVGETYWQHLRRAFFTVLLLCLVQCALVVHALFPFLLVHTASNKLKYIIRGIPSP